MMAERSEATLVEVADGVHAYLQRGSWGFSNAGLVAGADTSLLVDTLYDVGLTARMLEEMRRRVKAADRIATVVNTHADGDHCWGNQLLVEADIVSSRAAAEEMLALRPSLMLRLMRAARGAKRGGPAARAAMALLGRIGIPYVGSLSEAGSFVEECFGSFDFRGIRLTPPTRTFEGKMSLTVGDKRVELIQVGPAHTKGDVIVYLPAERVVFTGDILFIGSHPIAWEGPVQRWIAACALLLELDADVVVPGHGPLTTKAGVRETKEYWERLVERARQGQAAGATSVDVAQDLLGDCAADWTEAHRLVVNVDTIYRDLAGDRSHRDPLSMFALMARFERAERRSSTAGGSSNHHASERLAVGRHGG